VISAEKMKNLRIIASPHIIINDHHDNTIIIELLLFILLLHLPNFYLTLNLVQSYHWTSRSRTALPAPAVSMIFLLNSIIKFVINTSFTKTMTMTIFTTILSSLSILVVIVSMVAITIPFSAQECQGFMPLPIALMGGSHRRTGYCCLDNNSIKLIKTTNNNNNNKITIQQRRMVVADNDVAFLSSDDPFVILGLDEPTADKKVLKRAYKRRAMKFHPDVITDIHSPPEDKKKASDRFAKINWAYATLTGKNKDSPSSSSTGRSSSSSSSSSGYTPPHRRSGGYSTSSSSSSSSGSNDWRDYMPDYGSNKEKNNDDYDTGGDSFGQIFSDFFTSAAVGAAGVAAGSTSGGGIFSDFVDFLEGNVGSGGGTGGDDDNANLQILLKTGSLEEVAEEMDDTELVVRQLESKKTVLDDELFATDAEAKMASKFSEKIGLEERAAELKARKDIVGGFLKRARTRLLTLQTRYKELITYEGANDSYVSNGSGRSRRSQSTSSSSPPRDSSSSSSSSPPSSGRTSSSSSTGGNDDISDGAENAWKNEGFGSSGRSRGSSSRGSGRRRAARRTTTPSTSPSESGVDSNPSSEYSSPSPSPSRTTDAPYSSSSASPSPSTASGGYTGSRRQPQTQQTTSSSSSLNKYGEIPPHRRTQPYVNRQEEDKQRMREIKVDEEFDKLKKELGL
jgi:hypothetical protein